MDREHRHKIIQKVISEKEISTQNELVKALQSLGHDITQATVSRDINELGLIKVAGKVKKFRYVIKTVDQKISKLSTLFKESVISIDTAMNMLVIKTYEGSANAACLLLDKLNIPNIVGTLAGEDTILVIAKNIDNVPYIYNTLKEYM
ncbi:arginine repressor [bacterium]|nr:arginine repressor [bacterium]